MKKWFRDWLGNWWWLIGTFVVFGLIVGAVVPDALESAREERACNECIETYCTEEIDGCECAQCIVLCNRR